jgi:hypothetical protein
MICSAVCRFLASFILPPSTMSPHGLVSGSQVTLGPPVAPTLPGQS